MAVTREFAGFAHQLAPDVEAAAAHRRGRLYATLLKRRLEALWHPGVRFEVRIGAAGVYAVNLERFLRGLPLPISLSVGQPKRNKDYQQVHFLKRKSDDTESHALARFAVVEQPTPTPEVGEEFLVLREVASRLQSRTRQTTRAVNQLHNLLSRVFPELATVAPDLSRGWVLKLVCQQQAADLKQDEGHAREEVTAAVRYGGR